MKKILIVGRPGSGKTTLAVKLANKLNLPLVHLDKIFWKPGWVEVDRTEFDTRLLAELEKDSWIIDGNYGRTIPLRLKYADTVICFEYPKILCIWRVLKRVTKNFGKSRPDMGENCPEKFDLEFLKFVWNCPSVYERVKDFPGELILVKSRKDFKKFFGDLF